MVFFNCNSCGESLKKNQVEKHYQTKCRHCEVLSCMDCGKEFWGDTYQNHIKCISEEEKYSGKNYVPKINKGEAKQEQWIQKVQTAIQKAPANPALRNLLQRLEDFPNIPRKKAKFENFLKCSLRIFNAGLVNQVWDLLMAEQEQVTLAPDKVNQTQPKALEQQNEEHTEKQEVENCDKILSKRERKEDRRKKMHKTEKKDKHLEENGSTCAWIKDKQKGKCKKREDKGEVSAAGREKGKRKREDNGEAFTKGHEKEKRKKREDNAEVSAEVAEDHSSEPHRKKKKTVENLNTSTESLENHNGMESCDSDANYQVRKGKFNWTAIIIAVLQKNGEISVKKLRKKVLSEYATYGSQKPEEKLFAKFSKKLMKVPCVKVLKDRVRLLES